MDTLVPGSEPLDSQWLPENDFSYFEGWRGPWADKLITKANGKRSRSLGSRTVVEWEKDRKWGVELRLKVSKTCRERRLESSQLMIVRQAKTIGTYVPEMDYPDHPGIGDVHAPPRCIEKYSIEATVLRVLISQVFLDDGILDNPVILPPDTPPLDEDEEQENNPIMVEEQGWENDSLTATESEEEDQVEAQQLEEGGIEGVWEEEEEAEVVGIVQLPPQAHPGHPPLGPSGPVYLNGEPFWGDGY